LKQPFTDSETQRTVEKTETNKQTNEQTNNAENGNGYVIPDFLIPKPVAVP
jgi:hypothetical protein